MGKHDFGKQSICYLPVWHVIVWCLFNHVNLIIYYLFPCRYQGLECPDGSKRCRRPKHLVCCVQSSAPWWPWYSCVTSQNHVSKKLPFLSVCLQVNILKTRSAVISEQFYLYINIKLDFVMNNNIKRHSYTFSWTHELSKQSLIVVKVLHINCIILCSIIFVNSN